MLVEQILARFEEIKLRKIGCVCGGWEIEDLVVGLGILRGFTSLSETFSHFAWS